MRASAWLFPIQQARVQELASGLACLDARDCSRPPVTRGAVKSWPLSRKETNLGLAHGTCKWDAMQLLLHLCTTSLDCCEVSTLQPRAQAIKCWGHVPSLTVVPQLYPCKCQSSFPIPRTPAVMTHRLGVEEGPDADHTTRLADEHIQMVVINR